MSGDVDALPYRRKEVIGDCELYLGDCTEILPHLSQLDHCITDPPYSEHVHSKSRAGGKCDLVKDGYMASYSRATDLGFAALTEDEREVCAREFARIVKRWTLTFSDIESCHLWRVALTHHGLDYCRTGIWRKLNATPQFTGDRPATAAETITIAHRKGRKKWNGGGRHAFWDFPIEINRSGHNPRLHTTQKPLPLMLALIADFTDMGETVLDPFMGSATTGIACLRLGRRFIGIEKDEQNFDTAFRRIRRANPAIFELTSPVQGALL